jgi:predicted DNA-binding protein
MKTSNITVRVSEDIKEKLRQMAEKEGITESQYVRSLITKAIEKKDQKDEADLLEERLKKLESQVESEPIGMESKFLMAMAYVFSIDTGQPMHKIVADTNKYIEEKFGYSIEVLNSFSREERERIFTDLYDYFDREFNPSTVAYLMIECIFVTFLSFIYPSPIFMITPFSMSIVTRLERVKSMLKKGKK